MSKTRLDHVKQYYDQKVQKFGTTSRGVDWNGEASHVLRFDQLAKVLPKSNFSLLDFGCGYGSLIYYLRDNGFKNFEYYGYDISDEMLKNAKRIHKSENIQFVEDLSTITHVDFVISNGVFNVKLDENRDTWEAYVMESLNTLNSLAKKGLAFNLLTSFSDAEFMQEKLYYADPMIYFAYCKHIYSRNVALLHDYDLYEFTLIIRKT